MAICTPVLSIETGLQTDKFFWRSSVEFPPQIRSWYAKPEWYKLAWLGDYAKRKTLSW